MSKRKIAVATKENERDFRTRDVVALYLGKYRNASQIDAMNTIGSLLTGIANFSYLVEDHRIKANTVLASQHKWLPSLEYNREGYGKWIANIEDNHGENLIIEL